MQNSASTQENIKLPTTTLTVVFYSEFHALTIPFIKSELGDDTRNPLATMSVYDYKSPSYLMNKKHKDIIEHILVAHGIAYNVKRMRLVNQKDAILTYRITVSKAQTGDTLLTLGDTILMNRKNAEGVDCVTLIQKDAPHYYRHLPYGVRPDSSDAIRKLHKQTPRLV